MQWYYGSNHSPIGILRSIFDAKEAELSGNIASTFKITQNIIQNYWIPGLSLIVNLREIQL